MTPLTIAQLNELLTRYETCPGIRRGILIAHMEAGGVPPHEPFAGFDELMEIFAKWARPPRRR